MCEYANDLFEAVRFDRGGALSTGTSFFFAYDKVKWSN